MRPISLREAETGFSVCVTEIGVYRDGAGRLVQLQQIRPIDFAFVGGHYQTSGFRVPARPVQRIPSGVSAYSFRHTRISELLQRYGVDPLTVAAQCGTSLIMIEKYYFKFIAGSMRDKLNAVRQR
jgi:integrase